MAEGRFSTHRGWLTQLRKERDEARADRDRHRDVLRALVESGLEGGECFYCGAEDMKNDLDHESRVCVMRTARLLLDEETTP